MTGSIIFSITLLANTVSINLLRNWAVRRTNPCMQMCFFFFNRNFFFRIKHESIPANVLTQKTVSEHFTWEKSNFAEYVKLLPLNFKFLVYENICSWQISHLQSSILIGWLGSKIQFAYSKKRLISAHANKLTVFQ